MSDRPNIKKLRWMNCAAACCMALSSCQPNQVKNLQGTWFEIQKIQQHFVEPACDHTETIRITADSIYHHAMMEDVSAPIHHVKNNNGQTTFFIDAEENSHFKFSWIDETKGISRWEIKFTNDPLMVKFFVNEGHRTQIKKVKGMGCPQENEPANETEEIKPDFTSADGKQLLQIKDKNCIVIYDQHTKPVFEECYEVDFIEVRPTKGSTLSLTFISGKHAIEIAFFHNGEEWKSNKATYFDGTTANAKGKTQPVSVTLSNFNFDQVLTSIVN